MLVDLEHVTFTAASTASGNTSSVSTHEHLKLDNHVPRGVQTPSVPPDLSMKEVMSTSVTGLSGRSEGEPATPRLHHFWRNIRTPRASEISMRRFSTPQTPPVPSDLRYRVGVVERALFVS